MAKKYKKTPAQIMLRWILQTGVVPIPKSTKPRRIKKNADIFDIKLDQADMEEISGLDEDLRTGWGPSREE